MNHQPDGIRKAALFVSALDRQATDRLLERFTPEQAQQLRQALVALADIDPAEQQQVIDAFFQAQPGPKPARASQPRPLLRSVGNDDGDEFTDSRANSPPFHFLQDAEAEKLSRALASERPQTVALVLSHLTPEQAGAVLVRLEPAHQTEVIRRLVDLEETDPEILREVERALRTRLSQQVQMQRRRVAGLSAVAGILRAAPRNVGGQILKNLSQRDRGLAEKLGPAPVAFDDLQRADAETWSVILGAANPEIAILALVGASPSLVERILRQASPAEAEILRRRIEHPGPIRLRDVEQAREEVAALARRLAIEGRIDLPGQRRQPLGSAA